MKLCTKCNIEKDFENFRKQKGKYICWCKNCEKLYKKEHYQKNKEKIDSRNKLYKENHEEQVKDYQKKYVQDNKEKLSKRGLDYYHKNKEHISKQKLSYEIEKRKTDPIYKLRINIRASIRMSLKKKGYTKKSRTLQILGIAYDDFMNYLFHNAKLRYPNFIESDYLINHKYHIDHIIPLATAKTEDDVLKLCHYTNLQLLTINDNLSKHKRLDWS